MSASGAQIAARPYALVTVYRPLGGRPEETVIAVGSSLPRMRQQRRQIANAWSRLVGGQYPALWWVVKDCRSGVIVDPAPLEEGEENGTLG